MTMRYANPDDVFRRLRVETDPLSSDYDAEVIALIERIENGLCDNFDGEVHTSFGGVPTPETRTVAWSQPVQPFGLDSWLAPYGALDYTPPNTTIILPQRIMTITEIRSGGDWDGSGWIDDDLMPATSYQLAYGSPATGYWAIRHITGSWPGSVRVTGTWADQVREGVPDDVREALTALTIDQYRTLEESPAQTIGPSGESIQIRNPWNLDSVKKAIERHRVYELLI